MSTRDTAIPSVEAHDPELCWTLLERVAASTHLKRAARLRELLMYVGQRAVRDGCDHLPEQEIGVRVFGRPEAYDNANDNIVRTNISELRKRIEAYFAAEGCDEPVIMEIPRGSYIPVFRVRSSATTSAEAPPPASITPVASAESRIGPVLKPADRPRWMVPLLATLLALACLALWLENRAAHRDLHPWETQPAIASLWSGFLGNGRNTDVVLEDSSFLLIQDLRHQTISLSDYLSGAYLRVPDGPGTDPVTANLVRHLSGKILGRASDFKLAQEIRALAPENADLHFYVSREYSPSLLQQDNVILLGNPTSNPWYQAFEDGLNFTEQVNTYGMSPVTNHKPQAGESPTYGTTNTTISYCAVAYLPKPDRSGNILLIQGTTSEATQAGGELLLSEDQLSDLLQRWHTKRMPYFELLLKVSHVQGSALTAQVEAYRTYPDSRR